MDFKLVYILSKLLRATLWSKVGHYSRALAKGPYTTTWIWSVHSDSHDYDIQVGSYAQINRKIFSSNLGHLAVVFLWLGGMLFHGCYFSNFELWIRDAAHILPSAQSVWPIVGQDILNSTLGGFVDGLYITSGLFYVWLSCGFITLTHIKFGFMASFVGALSALFSAYFHMHVAPLSQVLFLKFRSVSTHHMSILFGLGSISWAGHQLHVSLPIANLLDSGVDPTLIPSPQDLLKIAVYSKINPQFSQFDLTFQSVLPSGVHLLEFESGMSQTSGSISMAQIAAHHLFIGISSLIASIFLFKLNYSSVEYGGLNKILGSPHGLLAINLSVTGSLSIVWSHHSYSLPVYPFLAADYPTVLSIFVHHMWIGGLLIVGSSSHSSIFMIRDYDPRHRTSISLIQSIISHRDIITGHLVWVSILLGFHSFGLLVHNDTLQALGRPNDMFSDTSICLKPIFALVLQSLLLAQGVQSLNQKVIILTQALGTSDFIVHHIHAFSIHCSVLILAKGVLYSRSSRLISDKYELGYRYPCDGPGRGGTCQVSAWDHVYLGVFWFYNSISVVVFHYFWKMQSDVWGVYESTEAKIVHITAGDFGLNSTTVNGWLRNLLWSQVARLIQSYSSSLSAYGLIFLAAHFVWAFSLMLLFSGRGYWQELIESILWAHIKLKIVPSIQPRALSITQGRAVGLCHYIIGGIGCTWCFVLARLISLAM